MNACARRPGDDDEPDLPESDTVDPGCAADDGADMVPAEAEADASPARRAAPPMVSDEQLAAWIAAIVAQDERALASLYDATFTRVFGLVCRIVRNSALAEEVVEDAYFQVWRQAARFDPARGKALAWLLAIGRSRAIDALRREVRNAHDTLPDEAGAQPTDEPTACDDLLDLARHHARLHHALLRLGAQPRQLVSLSFFRGLSHDEIAEQMGLPVGTVKSQIRRALLALRDVLGDARSWLALS